MVAGRLQFPERYDGIELAALKPLIGKHFTFNEVNTRHLDKNAGMWCDAMQGYKGGSFNLTTQGNIPRFLTVEQIAPAINVIAEGRDGFIMPAGASTGGAKILYKKTRDSCTRIDQAEWPDVMFSVVFKTQNKNAAITAFEKVTYSLFGLTDIDLPGTGLPGATANCIYFLVTSYVFDFDTGNRLDVGCRTSLAGSITLLKDISSAIVIADTFNQISERLEMTIVVRNSLSKRAVEFYMRGALIYTTAETITPNLPTGRFLYPFMQHFGFGAFVNPCSSWFSPALYPLNDRELP